MTAMPNIRDLQYDVVSAESEVARSERIYGRDSAEYRQALIQFTRIWSVLRMQRRLEEFIQ